MENACAIVVPIVYQHFVRGLTNLEMAPSSCGTLAPVEIDDCELLSSTSTGESPVSSASTVSIFLYRALIF